MHLKMVTHAPQNASVHFVKLVNIDDSFYCFRVFQRIVFVLEYE